MEKLAMHACDLFVHEKEKNMLSSLSLPGTYNYDQIALDSLQHRRVFRKRVVVALLHRLQGQVVEVSVSPLKLFSPQSGNEKQSLRTLIIAPKSPLRN